MFVWHHCVLEYLVSIRYYWNTRTNHQIRWKECQQRSRILKKLCKHGKFCAAHQDQSCFRTHNKVTRTLKIPNLNPWNRAKYIMNFRAKQITAERHALVQTCSLDIMMMGVPKATNGTIVLKSFSWIIPLTNKIRVGKFVQNTTIERKGSLLRQTDLLVSRHFVLQNELYTALVHA